MDWQVSGSQVTGEAREQERDQPGQPLRGEQEHGDHAHPRVKAIRDERNYYHNIF